MEITYCFKSKDPEAKIVAEFGVKIPEWDLTLTKLKLIKTLNGGLFIAGPSFKGKDKEGKETYKDYWYFGKDTGARFKETVLKLLNEHMEKTFGKTNTMVPFEEDLF